MQQIQSLLAQLVQMEPEPEIQQAVQTMSKQAEALEGVLGKDDEQDMQSGLANPTGGGAPSPAGGPEELPGAGAPGGDAGGGEHHGVAEVHIKMTPEGGPKTFGDAKKAAMAMHAEKGHFDPHTPAGETPSSQKSKSKAKG